MGSVDISAIRENILEETGHWFALPSFFEGIGRAIDLMGTLNVYINYPTPEEADRDALRRDIAAVGRDIWYAIGQEQKLVGSAAVQLNLFPKGAEGYAGKVDLHSSECVCKE